MLLREGGRLAWQPGWGRPGQQLLYYAQLPCRAAHSTHPLLRRVYAEQRFYVPSPSHEGRCSMRTNTDIPLRGFRLLVGRGRTPTPARRWRDRSPIRLVGADGHAIHQRIEAQVQSAGVAMIGLGRIRPLVGMIVNDGPATRRTPPRHARTLARCPSARCSESNRVCEISFATDCHELRDTARRLDTMSRVRVRLTTDTDSRERVPGLCAAYPALASRRLADRSASRRISFRSARGRPASEASMAAMASSAAFRTARVIGWCVRSSR